MSERFLCRGAARTLATALLALLVAGCDNATGSVPSAAVGTYTLVRVNGELLPFTLTNTSDLRVDLEAGELLVRSDGSYREVRGSRITDAQGTRTGSSLTEGTLRVTGSSLEVRERVGGTYPGSFTGTTLSYSIPGGTGSVTFTYDKD